MTTPSVPVCGRTLSGGEGARAAVARGACRLVARGATQLPHPSRIARAAGGRVWSDGGKATHEPPHTYSVAASAGRTGRARGRPVSGGEGTRAAVARGGVSAWLLVEQLSCHTPQDRLSGRGRQGVERRRERRRTEPPHTYSVAASAGRTGRARGRAISGGEGTRAAVARGGVSRLVARGQLSCHTPQDRSGRGRQGVERRRERRRTEPAAHVQRRRERRADGSCTRQAGQPGRG